MKCGENGARKRRKRPSTQTHIPSQMNNLFTISNLIHVLKAQVIQYWLLLLRRWWIYRLFFEVLCEILQKLIPLSLFSKFGHQYIIQFATWRRLGSKNGIRYTYMWIFNAYVRSIVNSLMCLSSGNRNSGQMPSSEFFFWFLPI